VRNAATHAQRATRARVAYVAYVALAAGLAAALVTVLAACGNDSGPTVRVTIRKGSSFREAAESLSAHGIMNSARVFGLYARARGEDRKLHYGTYVIRRSLSWGQILDAVRLGKGIVHQITIPEGFTIAQITPLLVDELEIVPDSIDVAVRDPAWRTKLGIPTTTLEGYLFPDTYTFPDNATARDAVRVMVERFEKVWKPEWTARAAEVKMSRHEVLTLASIVEREVFRNDERPVVAAVYLNRLKAHIPLQADPTVQYALGKKPGRVLYRDLRVVSPYNTYLNPGLPPGPIASPGAASIEAALHPAKVPYRFFVAAPDGHHEFRRTFAEHEAAIAMVRAQKAAITAAEGLAASRAERTLKTAPDSTVKTPKDSATKRP
jgi:UPF0755 protein